MEVNKNLVSAPALTLNNHDNDNEIRKKSWVDFSNPYWLSYKAEFATLIHK